MAYLKTLERSRRIRMFLDEYYFGNGRLINGIRLAGGPILLLAGAGLWLMPVSRAGIAYAGACIFYGLYYTLKPWFWILVRDENFKTLQINVEVRDDIIRLVEDASEAEIRISSLRRIMKRRTYYILEIAKYTKMYLPFSLLNERECLQLDQQMETGDKVSSGEVFG